MIKLSKYLSRVVIIALILWTFTSFPMAAQEGETPIPQEGDETFPPYEGPFPGDLEPENCTVPISSLGGQGHHVSGVERDLTMMPPGLGIWPGFAAPQLALGSMTSSIVTSTDPDSVAILVVDAFQNDTNGDPITDLSAALSATNDDDLKMLARQGDITHGALVMNHTNALIESLGYSLNNATTPGYVVWEMNGNYIAVVAVDAINYGPVDANGLFTTTATARDSISEAIQFINDGNVLDETGNVIEIRRYVVNMSFAILPCETVYGFYTSGEHSFAAYFNSLASIDVNFLPQAIAADDELVQLFAGGMDELVGSYEIDSLVPVASSGNSSLPFPFAPAIAPQILSVSAGPILTNLAQLQHFANRGEFIEDGGWFRLVNAGSLSSGPASADVFYVGTSFSAPALSTRIAHTLTEGVADCLFSIGNIPNIAYAGSHEQMIQSAAASGPIPPNLIIPGNWWQITFDQATSMYC